MSKALLIAVGVWLVAACVVVIVFSPTATLRQVSAVFLVWLISGALNALLLIVMASTCALTLNGLKSRDVHIRYAVWLGMQSRWFWIGFWGSAVAWVVTTLSPLGLLVALPLWSVAAVFAVNLLTNLGAIPFRIWIWRIHTQDEVPVA